MKLWLIYYDGGGDYDTYRAAVVAAETEDDARRTHPDGSGRSLEEAWRETYNSTWASAEHQVTVEYIGEAKPGTDPGVILADFNAG